MCASFLLTRAALQSAFTSSQSVSVAQMADTSEPQPQSQQIDRKYLFLFFFFFFFTFVYFIVSHKDTARDWRDQFNNPRLRAWSPVLYISSISQSAELVRLGGAGGSISLPGCLPVSAECESLYILDILVVAHDIPMIQPSSSSSPPITLKALLTNRRQFQRHRRPSEAMYGSCCRHGSNKDEGM